MDNAFNATHSAPPAPEEMTMIVLTIGSDQQVDGFISLGVRPF